MIDDYQNSIGLLDSGVGGLSVLSQLCKLMPERDYVFFGDTKNVPYGTKTPEQIFEYTKDILNFFIKKGIKTAVFACNTTSAVAYDELKKYFDNKIKIYPLIQTIAKSATDGLSDNDTIAILATKATINSKKYEEEIRKYNPHIKTLGIDCTGFVEIVENRLYEDEKSLELIKSKLEIVKNNNAKRVVLGCTHYPYLVDIFKKFLNVDYFNPALTLAKIVKETLPKTNAKNGQCEFYVSAKAEEFILSAKTFFDVKEAKLIEL